MKNPLTELINIGPKTAEDLNDIGIDTVAGFMSRDPYEIFGKLLEKDPTLCRCSLAGIVGAHEGVKWHTVTKEAAAEFMKRHPKHIWPTC